MTCRVLVGLDGSVASEAAVQWARLFADPAEIALMKVTSAAVGGNLHVVTSGRERSESEKYLKEIAERDCPGATAQVRSGSAAAVLLGAAEDLGAEIIAIASRRSVDLPEKVLGGTTEKLLHASSIPLLVVPAQGAMVAPARLQTVVVLLDGSKTSEAILPIVRALAKRHDSRLILAHCLRGRERFEQLVATLEMAGAAEEVRRVTTEFQRHVASLKEGLEGIATGLNEEGLNAGTSFVSGDPPGPLHRLVRAEAADLVAMSAHGYGTLKRLLLGSIASRMVRESRVPVLVGRRGPDKGA